MKINHFLRGSNKKTTLRGGFFPIFNEKLYMEYNFDIISMLKFLYPNLSL